jgi:hypothetical protein
MKYMMKIAISLLVSLVRIADNIAVLGHFRPELGRNIITTWITRWYLYGSNVQYHSSRLQYDSRYNKMWKCGDPKPAMEEYT